MEQKYAKTCSYALLVALLVAGVVAIAGSNSIALAQPCSAQLGSPTVYAQQYSYYGSDFQVTVPVSAACSSYTGPLYAIGTAYENGANIGTANTVLSPTYGGNGFSGQLSFTLPTSLQYNSVQFSVSIYSTQNGYADSLLTTTLSTFELSPTYYPNYPYYQYSPSYPYYPSYSSSPSYPSYPSNTHNSGGNPSYPSYPSYPSNQHNSGGNQHSWGGNPSYSGSSCYNSSNCYSNNGNNSYHHNSNH